MSWAESEKLNEWIQRAFENGRAEERERIIKLLENEYWHALALDYKGQKTHISGCLACEQIALIKGENK